MTLIIRCIINRYIIARFITKYIIRCIIRIIRTTTKSGQDIFGRNPGEAPGFSFMIWLACL
jgi:hypothetical protein